MLSWLFVLLWIHHLRSSHVQALLVKSDDAETLQTLDVVVIKVGGSSITDKGRIETLNTQALDWFSRIISDQLSTFFRGSVKESQVSFQEGVEGAKSAFIVIHGAGSFGHHTAKEFGLKGQYYPPSSERETQRGEQETADLEDQRRRFNMEGVSRTRLSVQKLNRHVTASLIEHGINAVSISPCFSIPGMQAHGGDGSIREMLWSVVQSTLVAGLIPVLHGDACLYGDRGAGIISGDTLMEILGSAPFVSRAIFLTDVDGVFTRDPRSDPSARLLRTLEIDAETSQIVQAEGLNATGSTHDHDVTGGLKTKLEAAISIVASGKNVSIAKCESSSAEQVIRGEEPDRATLMFASSFTKRSPSISAREEF